MTVIFVGVLLVFGGVLFYGLQGHLARAVRDRASRRDSMVESTTLEPQGRSAAFDPKANWPGLALIALGTILLFVGTNYL